MYTSILQLKPVTLATARDFLKSRPSHLGKQNSDDWLFAIGLMDLNSLGPDPELVGVIVGLAPQGGGQNDGYSLELLYFCDLGSRNASSILLAAACRAAEGLGYQRVLVYQSKNDGGSCLLAIAFHKEQLVANGELWRWVKHINQKKRSC